MPETTPRKERSTLFRTIIPEGMSTTVRKTGPSLWIDLLFHTQDEYGEEEVYVEEARIRLSPEFAQAVANHLIRSIKEAMNRDQVAISAYGITAETLRKAGQGEL
jgi:hypothetical protein